MNWVQLLTRVGALNGPLLGQADEGGDGGADAFERAGTRGDFLDVDTG